MDTVNKLETQVAAWYKTMPHMPEDARKWLAQSAWWLTLIGVIIGGLGTVGLVAVTFSFGTLLGLYGGAVGAAIGGIIFIAALVSIAFLIVTVVLGALAVNPLKAMLKKGWTLLFIIVLVRVVHLAVSFLFNFNLFGLIWGLFVTAVGAYFLFEIRDLYVRASSRRKVVDAQIVEKTPSK